MKFKNFGLNREGVIPRQKVNEFKKERDLEHVVNSPISHVYRRFFERKIILLQTTSGKIIYPLALHLVGIP